MDKKFLLKIALRNLWSHKLRTILTLAGMTIGTAAIFYLVSFGFGIEQLVTKEITGGNAFELIDVGTGNSQIVKLDTDTINKIKEIPTVKDVQGIVNAAGQIKKDDQTADIAFFATTGRFLDWAGKSVKIGSTLSSNVPDGAIINSAYLDFLGIQDPAGAIGKSVGVDVVVPKEFSSTGEAKTYKDQIFKVVGVIKDGATTANLYANLDPYYSTFEMKSWSQAKAEVTNRNVADATRKQIENLGLRTQYVGETITQVEQVFNFFKIILGSFGLIALIVAALGMFNILTISLLERIKEIALMKILGMKKSALRRLFLTESIIISLTGGIMGLVLGVVCGIVTNSLINRLAVKAGGDPVSLFSHPLWFTAAVLLFAFIVGLITGIYPAIRATRVKALDVLRYE